MSPLAPTSRLSSNLGRHTPRQPLRGSVREASALLVANAVRQLQIHPPNSHPSHTAIITPAMGGAAIFDELVGVARAAVARKRCLPCRLECERRLPLPRKWHHPHRTPSARPGAIGAQVGTCRVLLRCSEDEQLVASSWCERVCCSRSLVRARSSPAYLPVIEIFIVADTTS